MESNLAVLGRTIPGAGRTCAWTTSGNIEDIPTMAGEGNADAVKLPEKAIAVGAIWPIAHVADGVRLVFESTLPPKLPDLEIFDGERWIRYSDGLAANRDGAALELSFDPVATTMLRIMVGANSGVSRIAIHRYMAEAKELSWPARVASGGLAERILACGEEPSFEQLRLYGLSIPAWAMMGLKDSGYEKAVWWDGRIHTDGRRIILALGKPPVRLADVRDTVRHHLADGWMPAVTVEAQVGQIALEQTSFVAFGDGDTDRPALFLRVKLTNLDRNPFTGPLVLEVRDAPPDPFAGTLGVKIFNPPQDTAPSKWELEENGLARNGQLFLASLQKYRAGKEPSDMVFDVDLGPGKTAIIDLVSPSLPWQPSAAEVKRLAKIEHAAAFAGFKAYWEKILRPAMKLDLPEKRLNNLYRGVLAQIFINAYGDIMPYGAAPSNYDGAVYGVEESYPMLALAMSGFGADAQRYMNTTYLRPELLAKAEKFTRVEDRNQQNHNGLKPTCAVRLFRLTGDRRWIAKHLEALKQCAEWTIASRRKTMVASGGAKPLHHGLLEMWAYGGDLHAQCYPLFPNICCWRGMKDTAWLLEQLGDTELAARYHTAAEDYRKTILNVIDKIYRKEAATPFLPLRLDATEPDSGDFYQLFAGLMLDLQPFEFTDPRSDYLGYFLEKGNRTFCRLLRFRRDGMAGGLDPIYGLGYSLEHLQKGRIRDFLLGFYAFQVFNMEHNCFTSREQNIVYSSDYHLRQSIPVIDWSDPLPCSAAVGLLLLRHLLVTEETRGSGDYTGKLLLLHGAPRRWYAAGNAIRIENAVTFFGKVTFSAVFSHDLRSCRADIKMTADSRCSAIRIRLRHPGGKPMKSATINGGNAVTYDVQDEIVEIPSPRGETNVVAEY